MGRHLEDLDNRGRRNNIRIMGLPEANREENLPLILTSIFNCLLGEPRTHAIKMDRAHRALRPKGASTLPRDVICCIHNYLVKEAIMAKAQSQCNLDYEGAPIQLFAGLSWVTAETSPSEASARHSQRTTDPIPHCHSQDPCQLTQLLQGSPYLSPRTA